MTQNLLRNFGLITILTTLVAVLGPGAAAQTAAAPNTALKPVGQTGGAAPKPATNSKAQLPKSPLKISGSTTLLLDPACNACAGAMLPLSVSNGEASQAGRTASGGKPYALDLRVAPLMSEAKEPKAADVRISVEPANEKRPLPEEIRPGESVAFLVKVTGVLAPGNWTTSVFNGTEELAALTFTLPAVTMNLNLEGADAKPPSLTLTRGEKTELLLKNDDAVGRRIKWDFRVGTDSPTEKIEDKVPGAGGAVLEIQPKEEWFQEGQAPVCSWLTSWMASLGMPCYWRAIFKDQDADGLLTVRLASLDCKDDAGAPVKFIHVKTTLAYYGANQKAWWSYLVTLFVLLLGALLSLYINFKFPDDVIRGQLTQQLSEIGTGIADLSMTLASRLRVLVGIELRLLNKQLKGLRWYTTEFETQRSQIADSAARLQRRVDLLKKMSRAREDYEHLATLEVPPAVMEKLEDGFEQLGRLLDDFHVAEPTLQEAEAKLNEMQKLIAGWQQPDTATIADLAGLLKSLYRDLQGPPNKSSAENGKTDSSAQAPQAGKPAPNEKGGVLYESEQSGWLGLLLKESEDPQTANTSGLKAIKNLLAELRSEPPDASNIVGPDYYRKALLAFRGEILRKYVLLCGLRDPKTDSLLWSKRQVLIPLLTQESWYALRKARRLVWEMSEDIYSEEIRQVLENKKAEIRLDRNLVRAFEPALLNVRFHAPKYDTCSAREEWSCTWNFGHGPFEGKNEERNNYLEEKGWAVAHYFPGKDKYTLTVRFRHEETGDLLDANKSAIYLEKDVYVGAPADQIQASGNWAWIVRPWKKMTRWLGSKGNAILRLVLALIPAILGMVAGAKDEFLKMDLFLAFGAIFLLGFGSDTVKNLLSQKTKS